MLSIFLIRSQGTTGAARKIARILSLLALATIGLAGSAAAQTLAPAVRLRQPRPASLRLRINNPDQLPGRVEVLSQQTGQSLYDEAYQTPAYGHRFDFDRLPAGRYIVLLRLGPDRYRYTVQVQELENTVTVQSVDARQSTNILVSAAN